MKPNGNKRKYERKFYWSFTDWPDLVIFNAYFDQGKAANTNHGLAEELGRSTIAQAKEILSGQYPEVEIKHVGRNRAVILARKAARA